MATGLTLKLTPCSVCQNDRGHCMCVGCKAFFCTTHFLEHRQQLSNEFDQLLQTYDELAKEINRAKAPNNVYADLFLQINRWKNATIEKVRDVAESTRQQLIQLINPEGETSIELFPSLTNEIPNRREKDSIVEVDIKQLQDKIKQLQRFLAQQTPLDNSRVIIVKNDQIDWKRLIYAEKIQETVPPRATRHDSDGGSPRRTLPRCDRVIDIPANAKWAVDGITVAGGNRVRGSQAGNGLNQLYYPWSLYVDDEQTIYIADFDNHRIMEWRSGATRGQVVAGGNGYGNRIDQLNCPSDVIFDKETDSLIICDQENRRVLRWPHLGGTSEQTIISDVKCFGLTMDKNGCIYVSDLEKHEVRRWRVGKTHGTVVAGGNGEGDRLDQLNGPTYVFVDRDRSVYVSDSNNHRVMKWVKGAKEGIVVAGGQGKGNALTKLSAPRGVFVDQLATVYVADHNNHRIMRWPQEATQGSIVVGSNGKGRQANQLHQPTDLSFDQHGNLYVVDYGNHRVQRFSIDSGSCS